MIYIKYMPYRSAKSASRNKRELSAAEEYGYETVIFSNDRTDPGGAQRQIWDGSVPMHPGMSKAVKIPKILCNYLRIWVRTAMLPDGVWSCHDLSALKTAWLCTRLRAKKPQLIYDAHEFELERNAARVRSARQRRSAARWECFLMKRCAFSIMVNDSIADEVQRIHRLKERPVVVRSTPNNWALDPKAIAHERAAFDAAFAARGEHPSFLVMYHGIVVRGRGIELLIRALAADAETGLVIFGNGQQAYLNSLQELAQTCGVASRVLFHLAVPFSELWKYVGAVDVDAAPIELVARNHYYSLPNKFFESIQSLTPVVTADVPEMARIIREYGIGLTFPPGDVEALENCLARMRTDQTFYAGCRQNLKKAKADLCWEREKEVLLQAFQTYLS